MHNRVTQLLGVEIPIVQAPMGWIARSQLASAVSNAGGMGIIETSSGEFDAIRGEIKAMRGLTTKPFGVNIAQAFVRHPDIVSFLADEGVRFVTTSAGDPAVYCEALKKAGFTVFHVVPTLKAALRAVECGVDGLVVEGGEGAGFKNAQNMVASMVLIPLIRDSVNVPIVAAGGIADGRSMAAAFALGAEGVQMGTRMVSSAEAPVHEHWKQAIVAAAETDTVVVVPRTGRLSMRALRTDKTVRYESEPPESMASDFAEILSLYRDGDMDASIAMTGQVAGRIKDIPPVAQIIAKTMREFREAARALVLQGGN
jgi:enoyl-[acyl-carrier protein] reductase II